VHDHDYQRFILLRRFTDTPMVLQVFSLVVILYVSVKQAWRPLVHVERVLLAASISLVVAVAFEYYLKFLFGRYWPDTWIDDNPSLIDTGAYGFNPFHFGEAYGSFPSGHTLRSVAFLGVIWAVYPAWRWVCVAVWVSVVLGLVGMNYHFVGDTIGGALVGAITAMYTNRFFDLSPTT
jgi:membrane-associated phospholipid phosphatase